MPKCTGSIQRVMTTSKKKGEEENNPQGGQNPIHLEWGERKMSYKIGRKEDVI